MKNLVLFVFIFFVQYLFAQDRSNRFEISLANDNDVYLLNSSDRYYTNGVAVNFSMNLNRDTSRSHLLGFELEHRLYNGLGIEEENITYWDRPFSAIFSLKVSLDRFIKDSRVFRLSIRGEQVGPKAHGEAIQDFIHTAFRMYEVLGWEDQLPNRFGVDFGLKYEEEFYKAKNNIFASSIGLNVVAGMQNVNFQAELPLRIGNFRSFTTSSFTKGHLNTVNSNNEFYFYYKPMITYQLKNSSLGDYKNNKEYLPNNEMVPIIITHQLGVTFAKKNSVFSFLLTRYDRELGRMKYKHHSYGRIQYSRKF